MKSLNKARLELHQRLCSIMETGNIYYQPPSNIRIQYPAIIYELSDVQNVYANSGHYFKKFRFKVTLITKDPTNDINDELMKLPYVSMSSFFCSDNLNHFVYDVYVV